MPSKQALLRFRLPGMDSPVNAATPNLDEVAMGVSLYMEPPSWRRSLDRVRHGRQVLEALDRQGVSIYGVNTLTGHRDNERVNQEHIDAFHEDFLRSHCIGLSAEGYDKTEVRFITYAKIYAIATGKLGVSEALFIHLCALAADLDFFPFVPKGCSYSSGDVIPGAHWARAVLEAVEQRFGYKVQPGEIMALINGNFIQVGYAASLASKLQQMWAAFLEGTAVTLKASRANASNLYVDLPAGLEGLMPSIERMAHQSDLASKAIQDPVSLRATPQVMSVLAVAMRDYLSEVDGLLSVASGNPLFSPEHDKPLSQASFLAPTLALRASALVDAVLFSMWAVTNRVTHLLSGEVEGIPRDASTPSSPLGLIQYPKLMMAILEKSRLDFGRRVFAAGSSTSYGVEDLWNHGLNSLDHLDRVLADFQRLLGIERQVIRQVRQFGLQEEDAALLAQPS